MKNQNEADKLIDKFNSLYPDRNILFFFTAGSHFFDLNTERSDLDFRGIYMPSAKELYEGEGRRRLVDWKTQPNKKGVKNTKNDIDCTFYSITKFLDLLSSGDFNMMEILFTPKNKIIIDSNYMKYLRSIRSGLLVNDISAFLGFIKKEYKRYGVNIYHYQSQVNFIKFLQQFQPHTKLKYIWEDIKEYAKEDQHINFTESQTSYGRYTPSVKISERMYQNTVRVDYVIKALTDIIKRYGHRQINMKKSGVEYKGLYHALRLIYEANDLYDFNELKIPFSKQRMEILKRIKTGNIDKNELFKLIDCEIEKLKLREQNTIFNKKQVKRLIDRIQFQLTGMVKINYLLKQYGHKDNEKI